MTKSYIPDDNAPIKMDVPVGQFNISNESQPHSKDKNPRTRKGAKMKDGPNEDIKNKKKAFGHY